MRAPDALKKSDDSDMCTRAHQTKQKGRLARGSGERDKNRTTEWAFH